MMIPIELQMVCFPPSLIDLLLHDQLTEPPSLPFTSSLAASRAKRGLYRLMRELPARPFETSQPDPCTLILKPTISTR